MYYRRNRWGGRGFPWMVFFLIIIFTHSWVGFLVSIGITLLVIMLMRALFTPPMSANNPMYTPPMSNWQPQPHEEVYYQPYQQGYQSEQVTYQEGEQQYQYPRPEPQYEQPQVQYPEELPPMEQ
jgi:hypothetical protein